LELQLIPHIESLIFAAESPITLEEISEALYKVPGVALDESAVLEYIDYIRLKYHQEDFGIQVIQMMNGYRFVTKGAYHPTISAHLKNLNKKRLSRTALETLAIIAYKQPVTKPEVESIRGVNCDYVIHKLLEKDLILISGRSEGPGRPLLYSTGNRFLDYFGLNDLSELPQIKDFHLPENQLGTPEEVMTLTDEPIPGPTATPKENSPTIVN